MTTSSVDNRDGNRRNDHTRTDHTRTYHTLDGLRGVAAIAIVILHIPHFFGGWHPASTFLAVDLFFGLSGFVLAAAYESRFARGMTPAQFIRIRLIRLYPLYLLGTLLGIPVAWAAMKLPGLSVVWSPSLFRLSVPFSLLMLPTPGWRGQGLLYPLDPVLWSIFFELLVNAVYVAGWRYFQSCRIVASMVGLSGLGLVLYVQRAGAVDGGFFWSEFPCGALRVLFSFFLGVLIYRMAGQRRARQSNFSLTMLLALLCVFFLPLRVGFDLLAILILLPVLVTAASLLEPGPIGKRLFSQLGVLSYSIYAIHKPVYQIVIGMLKRILPVAPETLAPWIGVMYIALLIPLCLLIHHVFDVPFRGMLTRSKTAPALKSGFRSSRLLSRK